jgi:hypothetical protein
VTALSEAGLIVPGTTTLAFRVWQYDDTAKVLLSLNDNTGRDSTWLDHAMAYPKGGWPRDRVLTAECGLVGKPLPSPGGKLRRGRKSQDDGDEQKTELHGLVPEKKCSCGVYATSDWDVINRYLRPAPAGKGLPVSVVGIVELGGGVIPHTQGARAEYARVAGILLLEEQLTEPHTQLWEVADAYNVPAIEPPQDDDPAGLAAEYYRDRVCGVGAEAEVFLRAVTGLDTRGL